MNVLVHYIIAAVKKLIGVEVAVNTALLRKDFTSLMLLQDSRTTSKGIDMAWFRHYFFYSWLRLKKDTTWNGGYE